MLKLNLSVVVLASAFAFGSCRTTDQAQVSDVKATQGKFIDASTEKNVQGYKFKNGILHRYIHMSNGKTVACALGKAKESSFTLRQIPEDKAAAYFEKDGDLWILNDLAQKPAGNCPALKNQGKVLVADIKESKITPAAWAKTANVVNLSLSRGGVMTVWGTNKVVFQRKAMVDISYNNCFKKKGKPFSSYIALGINTAGHVIKVKPSGQYKYDTSKNWESLSNFKKKNQITCN